MSYHQLTDYERYQIYSLRKKELSQNQIARRLGRRPSTISRELKRNKRLNGYRPARAQRMCALRKKRRANRLS